jgi:hypothetical protein
MAHSFVAAGVRLVIIHRVSGNCCGVFLSRARTFSSYPLHRMRHCAAQCTQYTGGGLVQSNSIENLACKQARNGRVSLEAMLCAVTAYCMQMALRIGQLVQPLAAWCSVGNRLLVNTIGLW